jgi:hypothetical protein
MKALHWLVEEVQALIAVTFYFALCFILIMVLKHLLLLEYGIAFNGLTTAIIIALVTAKVVLVLRKVPLSRLYEGQPAIVDVIARTLLYTFATLLALLLERAFEARHEHGGFLSSLVTVFEHRETSRVWATTICVGLAFAGYNAFGVFYNALGPQEVRRLFFRRSLSPTPE